MSRSANLQKYQTSNRLYRWHLDEFQGALYELLAAAAPETVLEAGCGEGFVLSYLAGRDPSLRLTGMDLDEEAIRFAQEHFGDAATFRTGSIYELPFPDDSFDLVLCSEVLEHLHEPERAVAELKRVARRHVLITVPREPYFKWLNDLGRWAGVSPDPGHVQFWTEEGFQRFIRAHFEQPVFRWKHVYQLALAPVG